MAKFHDVAWRVSLVVLQAPSRQDITCRRVVVSRPGLNYFDCYGLEVVDTTSPALIVVEAGGIGTFVGMAKAKRTKTMEV